MPITLPSEGYKVQEWHDDNTERPDVNIFSEEGQSLVLPIVNMNDENQPVGLDFVSHTAVITEEDISMEGMCLSIFLLFIINHKYSS